MIDSVAVRPRKILRSSLQPSIRLGASVLLCAALLFSPYAALAGFVQQGPKLVGTGAVGHVYQGDAVAVSADGNTAIVGGGGDNGFRGAAWVYTRSGGVWTQQGSKLVGTGVVGYAYQADSVGLSADGNTAIVGGHYDNEGVGAAWVFTRSGGVWSQQGSKLVGTGAVGNADQGWSVALSADGNTAIVGGVGDHGGIGATWVFTRIRGVWTQQGSKLVGTGFVGRATQGWSVALSADGNTAIVGGVYDNGGVNEGIGATWVFTRSGGVWSQQGEKQVGTDAVGPYVSQGSSVALSADGNTAIVGGYYDNYYTGAAWVFTRSGGVWSQQGSKLLGTGAGYSGFEGASVALSANGNTAIMGGYGANAAWVFTRNGEVWRQLGSKLVGTGAVGEAHQGASVALSGDGNTAIVGGYGDNGLIGAAWVFVQPAAATHDFNGDHLSDILWRNGSTGRVVGWLMNGNQIAQSGRIGGMHTYWKIVAQRDFNGDGKTDILWRNSYNGGVLLWLMDGLQLTQSVTVDARANAWIIAGVGDFNGDGKADIVWRYSGTGATGIWLMDDGRVIQGHAVNTVMASNWTIIGAGSGSHILWRDRNTGDVVRWTMNAFKVAQSTNLGSMASEWVKIGDGDFDGNGSSDILWRNSVTGKLHVWLMNGDQIILAHDMRTNPSNWSVDLIGDFDGDGKSDIVWTNNDDGRHVIWFMDGHTVARSAHLKAAGTTWSIQSSNAE